MLVVAALHTLVPNLKVSLKPISSLWSNASSISFWFKLAARHVNFLAQAGTLCVSRRFPSRRTSSAERVTTLCSRASNAANAFTNVGRVI